MMEDLASHMQRYIRSPVRVAPQGQIAREIEDLERRSVAYILHRSTPGAYYGLTEHGRDFMLEQLRPQRRLTDEEPTPPVRTGAGMPPPAKG